MQQLTFWGAHSYVLPCTCSLSLLQIVHISEETGMEDYSGRVDGGRLSWVQGDGLPNPDDTGRLIMCRKRVRPRKTRHSVFSQSSRVPCWQSSALWRQYGCWNLWNGQCCWWLEGQMKCRPAILCLKIHFWSRQRGGNFWEHDKRHSSVSLAFSAAVVVALPHSQVYFSDHWLSWNFSRMMLFVRKQTAAWFNF